MRRFSQRSGLVTLSEINITPLLDLAFVLLIIFVITTPLLEQGIPLTLPSGGTRDQKIERENTRTVEISGKGEYVLNKNKMGLADVEQTLAQTYRGNPNLVVYVRAEKSVPIERFTDLIDRLQKHGIRRISIRSTPPEARR
jgi:biopolymer transport protein ExbD